VVGCRSQDAGRAVGLRARRRQSLCRITATPSPRRQAGRGLLFARAGRRGAAAAAGRAAIDAVEVVLKLRKPLRRPSRTGVLREVSAGRGFCLRGGVKIINEKKNFVVFFFVFSFFEIIKKYFLFSFVNYNYKIFFLIDFKIFIIIIRGGIFF
jgi:hypothetical protein